MFIPRLCARQFKVHKITKLSKLHGKSQISRGQTHIHPTTLSDRHPITARRTDN